MNYEARGVSGARALRDRLASKPRPVTTAKGLMINFIYKRGRIWWWQYRPHSAHGKPLILSLGTSDKAVAEKRRSELLTEKQQEAAGLIPPKPLREAAQRTLMEHLDDFLADCETMGRSDKHLANLRHRVSVLIRACHWNAVKDVTADSFQEWRRCQRLSAKTLNDYLEAIRSLLNWMMRHGRVLTNPLRHVEKVQTLGRETRVRRAFTAQEVCLLIASAPSDRRAIYLMAIQTGLRHSELGALRWGDLCLEGETPLVRVRASTTKNGKPIAMPLHKDVVAALQAIRPQDVTDGAPVFPRMPRIERFRRDLKKAGIPYTDGLGRFGDFHSLRYTFCTNLAKAGIPSRVAMSLMRHSDRRLTDKIYTDENLLGTVPAIEALPSYTNGLLERLLEISDIGHRNAVAACHHTAQTEVDKSPENQGESHDLARVDTECHEMELAGVTGLEPATSAVTGRRSKPVELHPRLGAACARLSPQRRLVGAKGLEPLTPSV